MPVYGSDLIYRNPTCLLVMPDPYPGWIGSGPGGHRCYDDSFQIPVHFIWGDHNTGSCVEHFSTPVIRKVY